MNKHINTQVITIDTKIKKVEKKVFLLNPVKNLPDEFNNHIVNALNALKKRSFKTFKTFEGIKVQGNFSIVINKIDMNIKPHNVNFGNSELLINN
jgi:hypothetical protein